MNIYLIVFIAGMIIALAAAVIKTIFMPIAQEIVIKLVDEPAFVASGQVGALDWNKVERYDQHQIDNSEVME